MKIPVIDTDQEILKRIQQRRQQELMELESLQERPPKRDEIQRLIMSNPNYARCPDCGGVLEVRVVDHPDGGDNPPGNYELKFIKYAV